jgi:hypothetical protein
MSHSLSMATRNSTPIKTPTVVTEAVVIRKMSTEAISHGLGSYDARPRAAVTCPRTSHQNVLSKPGLLGPGEH